jgi:hypothetical protein
MKPLRACLLVCFGIALMTTPPRAAAQAPATCDPERLDRESYRLTTEAQALNVLRPRSRWWDGFLIGKHLEDLADLNGTAIFLAERARELDDRNLLAHAVLARGYLVTGEDATKADAAWRRTLDGGGAITWTATLYDVDARSYFVLAFDKRALRVYRFGQLAGALDTTRGMPTFPDAGNARFWRAMGGCLDATDTPEAVIPWSDVAEIKSGNWVLWFKFRTPVKIRSDRGKKKELRALKVNLHGQTGDLTFYYNLQGTGAPGSRDAHRRVENLRGIAVGPTDYQRRVQQTVAKFVDPAKRIKLPQKGRGAGW